MSPAAFAQPPDFHYPCPCLASSSATFKKVEKVLLIPVVSGLARLAHHDKSRGVGDPCSHLSFAQR